jgi:hypothetical protein
MSGFFTHLIRLNLDRGRLSRPSLMVDPLARVGSKRQCRQARPPLTANGRRRVIDQ